MAQAGDTHHPSHQTLPATRTVEVVETITITRLVRRKQLEIGRRLGTSYRRRIDQWITLLGLLRTHVIKPSGGNMSDQCRVYIKELKLLCCNEKVFRKVFKLSISITPQTIMRSDDFYSTMPDPLQYLKEEKDEKGNSIFIIITNPVRKVELDTIWSKNLNSFTVIRILEVRDMVFFTSKKH
jgi:hypothetical protein